jgi:hypothetical protein
MERMSDVISYILQETIAAFIQSKQREWKFIRKIYE